VPGRVLSRPVLARPGKTGRGTSRCGLEGRFGFVVFSQDHGVEKPDPALFEVAMRQAGCGARELLHVGDSLEDDVAGTRRAGVRSVWLNRERKPNNTDVRPHFEISSLKALVPIAEQFR